MAKQAKSRFYWKSRTTKGQALLDVWLIRQDGAAHECLMHGMMDAERIEKLKKESPLEWVEEHSPYEDSPDSPPRKLGVRTAARKRLNEADQQTLFDTPGPEERPARKMSQQEIDDFTTPPS